MVRRSPWLRHACGTFFCPLRQETGTASLNESARHNADSPAWVPCFAYVEPDPTLRLPSRVVCSLRCGVIVRVFHVVRRVASAFGVHVADNGLTAGFYCHLADRDALFAAPTVSVKRLE